MIAPANPLRHQLPVRSPVPARGLADAVRTLVPGAGDPLAELEALLRQEYGVTGVRLVESGTQALVLALEAAASLVEGERGEGGDGAGPAAVALPAYSCFDVAAAAVAAGRPVRFYDLDPAHLAPDPDSLQETLRAGARIVVVAPLHGIPLDWDVLGPLLDGAGAVVVEDAAQGHGARWRGRPVGGRGRFSVLSFGRGKGWTGAGGGGALLLGDAEAVAAVARLPARSRSPARTLRALALSGALWALARPGIYRLPRALPLLGLGETRYREPSAPAGMTPGSAAFLLASRAPADAEIDTRRDNAASYREELAGAPSSRVVSVDPPAGAEPGYLRFPLLLRGAMSGFTSPRRARLLGAEAGYPQALPHLPQLASLLDDDQRRAGWPGAAHLVQRMITLPTHSCTRPAERRELVRMVRET